jgi:hypothetical protein
MLSNCKRGVKLKGCVIGKINFDKENKMVADIITMSVKGY